jgi:signal transduction histidine kinase
MTPAALATLEQVPPVAQVLQWPPALADELVDGVASADDVRGAMTSLVGVLRRHGAARVEWWRADEHGELVLELDDGHGFGTSSEILLGPVGSLVLVGDGAGELTLPVTRIVPLLRRLWTEEQLTGHVALLARRNEALEDFAALVAHELKSPLYALRHTSPSSEVEQALAIVDSILEIARTDTAAGATDASTATCLEEALSDLGEIEAEVVAQLPPTLPIPPAALRLLLRNLIGNAVSAGSKHIRVSAVSVEGRWTLLVDDDGVGLGAPSDYATGTRLGFNLSRRLVARLGGALELKPRARGGTRAVLSFAGGCA